MAKRVTKNGKAKTAKNPKGAGRPVNEAAKAKFLRIYPELGTIKLAAEKTPISVRAVYKWAKADETFAAAFEELKPIAGKVYVETLENEARRRAVEGVLEPVFYKGGLVDHVRKYSDTLLMFLLNGAAPEKYRQRTEVSGPNGAPINPQQTFVFVLPDGTKKTASELANASSISRN